MPAKLCPFRLPTAQYNVVTYGAAGNGTTDDTAAVQAAIDAAGAAGNGAIVFFPAGTYLTNKLNLVSNVELRGPFTSGTPRPTAWTATLKHKNGDDYSHLRAENKSDITIRYLAFDGAGATSSGRAPYFYLCDNVSVIDCHGYDYSVNSPVFQFEGGSYGSVLNCTFENNKGDVLFEYGHFGGIMDNCLSNDCLWEVFSSFQYGSAYYAHNNIMRNCVVDHAFTGCNIEGLVYDNLCQDNVFTNCRETLVFSSGAHDNIATGCTITGGAYSTGAAVNVASTAGAGNEINDTDVTSWTITYSYIIAAACTIDHNTITGSTLAQLRGDGIQFTDNTIVSPTEQGIFLDAAKTGINLSGNAVSGAGSIGIYIAAAQTAMTLTGNTVTNSISWAAGIQITVTGGSYTFVGNHCHGQDYGVDIHAGATGTYSADNDMTGNTNSPDWGGLTAV